MSNVQEAAAATQDLNIEVKEQPFAAPSQEGLFNPSTGLINQDVAGIAANGSLIESLKTSNLPWDVEEDTPYSGYPDDLPTVGGAPLGRDRPIRTIQDFVEDPNNPGFARYGINEDPVANAFWR